MRRARFEGRRAAEDRPQAVDKILIDINENIKEIIKSKDEHTVKCTLECIKMHADNWEEFYSSGCSGDDDTFLFPEALRSWLDTAWRDAMVSVKARGTELSAGSTVVVRRPNSLHRYHAGGNLILGVGIVAGVIACSSALIPPWAGFLAGAVPTWLLAALAHTIPNGRG